MGLTSEDAAHLLRRVGFGPTPGDIAALEGMAVADAVEAVLSTASAPAVTPPPEALTTSTAAWWDRYVAILAWWCDRMATTPCPIQEKMTLFWHGHFCSGIDKVSNFPAIWNQNQLFRRLGMGSFTTLTQAVAIDPAMLVYLDNASNVVWAPNENWARESMELFTLGVGNYTQDDVVASARAWTGHGVDSTGTNYVFTPAYHDTGLKTFFGTTANLNGPDILNEILTGPSKATVARFIADKLWSFLAYPNPEQAVSDAITADFLASTDLDITALLRSILNNPQFWSAEARQGRIRTPAEYVVATMRYTGLDSAQAHPDWYMGNMGQQLFNPPNVAGWHDNAYWISSAAFWARAGFAQWVTWTLATPTGPLAQAPTMGATEAVAAALAMFGITSPSPETVSALESFATAENTPSNSWAIQPDLITLTMLSPDYQVSQ
jgi:uncharacterized protein (DUF1800 family)